uniref:Crinkler effector protein N-terminal domain-containing protein n=1 Tax=Rhizophagus irregularis (strain DAOM 181602 / DAOM 197198 / MUCL 43194) TaxID=747089 RepID=U9TUM8_RHIID
MLGTSFHINGSDWDIPGHCQVIPPVQLSSCPVSGVQRSQHKKYLQKFWQEAIEECERNPKKMKQNEDKENVRGDVPAAVHAITIKIRKENTIGELKDLIREKINTSIIAKDIKLWKIKIPDNHDDELANFPLQNSNMLLATRKIGEYWEKMPPK